MTDQPAAGAPQRANSSLSSARAEAARRNGARSRGPRTPDGKERAAQNALKHGLRAQKFVLLADEDAAEFEALEEALRTELAPEGALQSLLVARVALAAWRMLRADRMEIELLDPHVGLDARGRAGDLGLARIRDGHGPRAFDTLLRYRGAVQAEFWRTLRALSALKAEDPATLAPPAGAAARRPSRPRSRRICAADAGGPVSRRGRAQLGAPRGGGALESERTRSPRQPGRAGRMAGVGRDRRTIAVHASGAHAGRGDDDAALARSGSTVGALAAIASENRPVLGEKHA